MSNIPNGLFTPFSTWGEYNKIDFQIQQTLMKMQTATLVKVVASTSAGDLASPGTVNVTPLVNQTDAVGNSTPHTTIFNVPYLRLQNASGDGLIIDPAIGDIGFCLFASRDISKVISSLGQAPPGSNRRYSYADAMYIGLGVSKQTPTQYIRFSASGIEIVSPVAITIKAPQINLQGEVNQTNGTITAQTDVVAGSGSISLVNHQHTSESVGDPTSPPL